MDITSAEHQSLLGGGECPGHYHLIEFDHTMLDQMQACMKIVSKDADYEALYSDDIIVVDTALGDVVITLPMARGQKEWIVNKGAAANNVIVQCSGSDLIYGSASITLTTLGQSKRLKSITGGFITL